MFEHNMHKSEYERKSSLPSEEALKTMSETQDNPDVIQLKNQLGEFEFHRDQLLTFSNGIIGFTDLQEFAIANIPGDEDQQFKILQSIEVPELSFIVLPTSGETSPLEAEDVKELATNFSIDPKDLALLFIVTIRNMGSVVKVTMNARAPIVLDTDKKTGRQYILPNQKYSIQHEL